MTPKPIIYTDLLDVNQTGDGSVELHFGNNQARLLKTSSNNSSRLLRSNSVRSFISPLDFEIEKPSTCRASTSQIREEENDNDENLQEIRINNFQRYQENIIRGHTNESQLETMSQASYNCLNG